jgi:hypothetical protein
LRKVIRESPDDPVETALAFDRITEETCTPWYRLQVARDHARHAQVQAAIAGHAATSVDDPVARAQAEFGIAAAFDPDVARAFLEVFSCLTLPSELLQRTGLAERVQVLGAEHEMPQVQGPTREQLIELVR